MGGGVLGVVYTNLFCFVCLKIFLKWDIIGLNNIYPFPAIVCVGFFLLLRVKFLIRKDVRFEFLFSK